MFPSPKWYCRIPVGELRFEAIFDAGQWTCENEHVLDALQRLTALERELPFPWRSHAGIDRQTSAAYTALRRLRGRIVRVVYRMPPARVCPRCGYWQTMGLNGCLYMLIAWSDRDECVVPAEERRRRREANGAWETRADECEHFAASPAPTDW